VNELVNVDVLAANRPGSRRFQAMALQPLLTTAALEHKGAEYYSSGHVRHRYGDISIMTLSR
jgi:hypothetical protein